MEQQPETTTVPAAGWVFLEVMGHRSHYGLLTEVERFGQKLARIDVFGYGEAEPRETHFYSGSSIFSITPATEERCRNSVSRWDPKPALLTHEPEPDDHPDYSDHDDEDDWTGSNLMGG